jgi:hypothetical protein
VAGTLELDHHSSNIQPALFFLETCAGPFCAPPTSAFKPGKCEIGLIDSLKEDQAFSETQASVGVGIYIIVLAFCGVGFVVSRAGLLCKPRRWLYCFLCWPSLQQCHPFMWFYGDQ